MKEKDKLRVYLEMDRDNGQRIAIYRNLEIEEVLENPEIIKKVVEECADSLRWYNIINKMKDGK
jgi:hypothetical protein